MQENIPKKEIARCLNHVATVYQNAKVGNILGKAPSGFDQGLTKIMFKGLVEDALAIYGDDKKGKDELFDVLRKIVPELIHPKKPKPAAEGRKAHANGRLKAVREGQLKNLVKIHNTLVEFLKNDGPGGMCIFHLKTRDKDNHILIRAPFAVRVNSSSIGTVRRLIFEVYDSLTRTEGKSRRKTDKRAISCANRMIIAEKGTMEVGFVRPAERMLGAETVVFDQEEYRRRVLKSLLSLATTRAHINQWQGIKIDPAIKRLYAIINASCTGEDDPIKQEADMIVAKLEENK